MSSFIYLCLLSLSCVHLWNCSLPNSLGILMLRKEKKPNLQVMVFSTGPVTLGDGKCSLFRSRSAMSVGVVCHLRRTCLNSYWKHQGGFYRYIYMYINIHPVNYLCIYYMCHLYQPALDCLYCSSILKAPSSLEQWDREDIND